MSKNEWAVIDATGLIHQGTEEEMKEAFELMNRGITEVSEEDEIKYGKWLVDWEDYLVLAEFHAKSIA